jgi:hypothetical protein
VTSGLTAYRLLHLARLIGSALTAGAAIGERPTSGLLGIIQMKTLAAEHAQTKPSSTRTIIVVVDLAADCESSWIMQPPPRTVPIPVPIPGCDCLIFAYPNIVSLRKKRTPLGSPNVAQFCPSKTLSDQQGTVRDRSDLMNGNSSIHNTSSNRFLSVYG